MNAHEARPRPRRRRRVGTRRWPRPRAAPAPARQHHAPFNAFDAASADLLAGTQRRRQRGASPRPTAGSPWPARSGCSSACWPPRARGGASPSGWRSTGDPPPARRPRRRRPRPGHRGRLRVRLLRTHPGRRHATDRRAHPHPRHGDPRPGGTGAAVTAANCLQSYAPQVRCPAPARCRPAARWRRSARSGHLVAGVSADSLLLGARNPITGRIEGFDIDVLRAVAQAIFGDPDKVELRVITAADRIPLLQDGKRRHRRPQHDDHLRPVEGHRASAPSTTAPAEGARATGLQGNRSWTTSRARRSAPRRAPPAWSSSRSTAASSPSPADTHTGCLVLFQQGDAHAITGDDTVLAGLAAQDPYAKVVGRRVHRRALRPGRQQGARRPGPVRQRRARADAQGRPADGRVRPVAQAGAGPGTRPADPRLRTPMTPMATPIATATAPRAPGRLGVPLTPPEALHYLDALGTWRDQRRAELDRLDEAALASPDPDAFTADILLSMALWKAVADRHDLLLATWDSGRVGVRERERLATLVWGRLDTSLDPRLAGAATSNGVPGSGSALAVSLPEACRLSDALAALPAGAPVGGPRGCRRDRTGPVAAGPGRADPRPRRRGAGRGAARPGRPAAAPARRPGRRPHRAGAARRRRRRPARTAGGGGRAGRAQPHRGRRAPPRGRQGRGPGPGAAHRARGPRGGPARPGRPLRGGGAAGAPLRRSRGGRARAGAPRAGRGRRLPGPARDRRPGDDPGPGGVRRCAGAPGRAERPARGLPRQGHRHLPGGSGRRRCGGRRGTTRRPGRALPPGPRGPGPRPRRPDPRRGAAGGIPGLSGQRARSPGPGGTP